MTSSSIRKHAGAGPGSDQPTVPEPAFAERARTLMYLGRIGSLSTLSRKQPGFPFGSVMPYGLDDHGRPIFLISTMAMHTQNLQADPRASLLVTQEDTGGAPLGASRGTVGGKVLPLPGSRVAEASSRSSRLSCALEDPGWHARCPHRILAGGKQSGRDSESLGRDGATGALAGRVNSKSGTQLTHTHVEEGPGKLGFSTDS